MPLSHVVPHNNKPQLQAYKRPGIGLVTGCEVKQQWPISPSPSSPATSPHCTGLRAASTSSLGLWHAAAIASEQEPAIGIVSLSFRKPSATRTAVETRMMAMAVKRVHPITAKIRRGTSVAIQATTTAIVASGKMALSRPAKTDPAPHGGSDVTPIPTMRPTAVA